jgi:phosphate starvation-inducible PhoH-like protein
LTARHDFAASPPDGRGHIVVAFDDNRLIQELFGEFDQNLALIEQRLGFLPGDMREKVDPYLRPLYDALYDVLPPERVERGLATGVIEIAPLAFMRGRTLSHAMIILDEAQNCTPVQLKMFLTRLGDESKMIVTGDPTQVDLPPGKDSGLLEAIDILRGIEEIDHIAFTRADVVRRELVGHIVDAYERAPKGKRHG